MRANIQSQGYSTDKAELVSVKRTELSSGYVNNALDLYEQAQKRKPDFVLAVEDDRETDRGSISSSSLHKPLTSSRSNQGQLEGLKDTGVSPLAGKPLPLKEKTCLPGYGPMERWLSINHYLQEQNEDTDPEALTHHKKPFYQRTWFACVMYGFLLLLLIAAILAIACNQAVIIRNTVLNGQIAQTALVVAVQSAAAENSHVQNVLASDSTTPIPNSSQTTNLSNGPSLIFGDYTASQSDVKIASNHGQAQPTQIPLESVTLSEKPASTRAAFLTAASPNVVSAQSENSSEQGGGFSRESANSWWSSLSLRGPLQLSASSNSVR